jgi:hypothetical protein
MKSSAKSWSAVSSSIEVSAEDVDRREPIMSRDRMVASERRSLPIRPTGDVTVVYATSAVMLPVVGDEGDRLWPLQSFRAYLALILEL